ncbi:TonB-dependent receptor domain-containing protein [Roseateles saccharophilus]|uniref:TonB-dependent receptor-like protein n=1 Tax=Roseateles saccharophilus TaxID=304 RepID=A0A4R3VFU9_ROSSA|nr:TonB-dependent receptor [Roseateles saccharophilus]MDG0831175.1 TonB-dependent receptor [Roseateles saccharophilus]TCV04296.1 TonB-dependent receptor-like protein [Roseateles saccharophilus]
MFKRNAMSAAVLACLTAAAVPALAQQQLERVEVTGSRILSVNAESAAPIQVMTAADIKASGVTNLQDLLLKNPTFGTPSISRTNSNFSTSSAGVSTVDLRNLGVDRTLVLVNGRRYVSGVPGSMAVDLNTIPTDFIERVEVMTGGASSTYGSDAVAGVVNIILKRNFEGVNMDASVGQSQKNDDTLKKFGITFGTNAADGKGNIMAHFAVSKQGAVYSRDREASAVDQISTSALTGEASDIFKVKRPFYSSFAPQGRFFYTSPTGAKTSRTFDANGNLIPFSSNGPAGDGVGATGFNRSAFRTIAIPTDRVLMATKGDYALNESHTLFFEGTYANTKTFTHLEPFPLDSSVNVTPGGGNIPAETLVNGVKVANPLIPPALLALMTDRNGDGLKDYNFTRRMSDVADRTQSANRDTFRVVGGAKGDLTKSWSYETYVGYGFTREGQVGTGQINVMNLYNALNVIPDAFGNPICVSADARKQGCVPANIFGANTLSAAAAKYINAPSSLNTSVSQKMAGASVTGDAFDLPAGPVGVAAGFEWRKEASATNFDALTQSGLNGGNALANTAGQYSVRELFVEAKLPLLKNLPAVKNLDGLLSYRHGDYSTVGGTNSWNSGLDWAVNSTVRVRATRAVSTRAPNIGDLYQGASQTFPTGLKDPCSGLLPTDTGVKADTCKSYPGVVANMAANGKFLLSQADLQGISGFGGGNPKLKSEQGKSTTVGLVLTPKSVDLLKNFTFTADYYDISIDRAINSPGRAYSLDQCFNKGNQAYCGFITRRTAVQGAYSVGSLEFISDNPVNSGGQKARGIDFTSSYAERVGPGMLTARLTWTHLLDAWNKPTDDADKDTSLGEVGNSRNRWMLNLGYASGPWAVNTTTTYIGKAYLDDQFMNGLCNTDANNVCQPALKEQGKVAAKAYFDLQGSYKLGKAQLYAGVNNLFNTKAPPIISGLPGNTTGAETDAGTYDAIGRRYYVGVRMSY